MRSNTTFFLIVFLPGLILNPSMATYTNEESPDRPRETFGSLNTIPGEASPSPPVHSSVIPGDYNGLTANTNSPPRRVTDPSGIEQDFDIEHPAARGPYYPQFPQRYPPSQGYFPPAQIDPGFARFLPPQQGGPMPNYFPPSQGVYPQHSQWPYGQPPSNFNTQMYGQPPFPHHRQPPYDYPQNHQGNTNGLGYSGVYNGPVNRPGY